MKFFIGLILGIAIAGGVAFYLDKAQNPFIDKGITAAPSTASTSSAAPLLLAPGAKMQSLPSDAAPEVAHKAKDPASAPSYDFYDVLQGKKDINSKPSASTNASQKTNEGIDRDNI